MKEVFLTQRKGELIKKLKYKTKMEEQREKL